MSADYTSDDPAERLRAVREAIGNCLKAQSYETGARSHTLARLAELRAMETQLMAEVSQASSGGIATVGVYKRPG